MFASLQLLNTPLNHHFRQQQQHAPPQEIQLDNPMDPFQFTQTQNLSGAGGFPFFASSQAPFIPSPPTTTSTSVKSEESPELCLAPGLLYQDDGSSNSSSASSTSDCEEPSTPPPGAAAMDQSHDHPLIPQKRRSPSESLSSHTRSASSTTEFASDSTPASTATSIPATGVHTASALAQTKPKRAAPATRISSKDFIPPDVTGLSKREARLVKNRAAAFLSRQRKREEFEALEVRCQELEAENAELRAGHPLAEPTLLEQPSSDSHAQAEITRLKTELDTAKRRAKLLESDLARLRVTQAEAQQRLMEMGVKTGMGGGVSPVEDGEGMDLEGDAGVEEVDAEEEVKATEAKEITPKNLMMALLMLISPLLAQDARKTLGGGSTFSASSSNVPTPSPTTDSVTSAYAQALFAPQLSMSMQMPMPIPSTPFEQFLKPETLSFDPSSFYSTPANPGAGTGEFDISSTIDLNMLSMASQSGSGGGGTAETGFGEFDFLKSPIGAHLPSFSMGHQQIQMPLAAMPTLGLGSTPIPSIEVDVSIRRNEEDPSKIRVRLTMPTLSNASSNGSSASTGTSGASSPSISASSFSTGESRRANLPADFLGFPPSPITALDGLAYSYSYPAAASGKMSSGTSTEKRRVRISLQESSAHAEGWDLHVDEC